MSDSEAHEIAEARLFVLSKIVERFDVLPEDTSWGGIIRTIEQRIEEAVEQALAEERASHEAEIAARERAAREKALREAAAVVCPPSDPTNPFQRRNMAEQMQAAAILALIDKEAAP